MADAAPAPSWLQTVFAGFGWRDALDIALVAVMATYLLRVMRESRALQLARGLGVLVLAAVIADRFSLTAAAWLLRGLLYLWVIALVIVLQPELRRLIATLGEQPFMRTFFPASTHLSREIAYSARLMIQQGWGGIIVLERETNLSGFAESGTIIDAAVKAELLASIFTPGAPLHDGAVIIRGGRVFAAACMLPLSESRTQAQVLGMRHRASLGITEETDALVVVMSEEHRRISLAMNGQLTPPLSPDTLEDMITLHLKAAGVPS